MKQIGPIILSKCLQDISYTFFDQFYSFYVVILLYLLQGNRHQMNCHHRQRDRNRQTTVLHHRPYLILNFFIYFKFAILVHQYHLSYFLHR